MPRQANGNYLAPANTAAITATTISSTAYNTLETDIGTEITNSLDRLGRSAMQAALPMGGNKVTGAADPTVATDLATKNYVDTATATFFSTGDVKLTIKSVADSGWIMMQDQTIGNVGSGAAFASATALALYTLLWNSCPQAYAPVTGGRGASASADWAGLKPMQILAVMGRALGICGSGSTLTPRALGQAIGEESHPLVLSELPNANLTLTGTNQLVAVTTVSSDVITITGGFSVGNSPAGGSGLRFLDISNGTPVKGALGSTGTFTPNGTVYNGGANVAHNNIQPTTFIWAMIKL